MGLMFWKKKPVWDKPFPEKLARRVSRIATPDLLIWADQALNETNRCISSYQSTGETLYLDEALLGAEAINALVSEVHKRNVLY